VADPAGVASSSVLEFVVLLVVLGVIVVDVFPLAIGPPVWHRVYQVATLVLVDGGVAIHVLFVGHALVVADRVDLLPA